MQGDFFLTNWFFEGMKWVHANITGNQIVLTIILCTIILKLITVFSDIKSRKYSMKMNALQPEIKRLQKKYQNDPKKMQAEQSKLMKQSGVSMMGGCLPMLIMMPLFFCFIAAFRYWGHEQMVEVIMELNETGDSTLFDSFKFLWVNNIWRPDNGTMSVVISAKDFLGNQELPKLLYFVRHPEALEVFKQLGFLSESGGLVELTDEVIARYNDLVAPLAAKYAGYNNGWFILPIVAAGSNFLTSWIMQRGQAPANADKNDPTQKSGKMMMYIFPIMSFFFCLTSNAAFAVYWIISSLTSLITNLILNKKFPRNAVVQEAK